jgi:ankyrin repeat protein
MMARPTALMYAAHDAIGRVGVVGVLLEAGAELDATDNDGQTALMKAAADGNEEAVRLLLQAGAVVDATGKHGKTALMWAAIKCKKEVVRMLLKAGAEEFRTRSSVECFRGAGGRQVPSWSLGGGGPDPPGTVLRFWGGGSRPPKDSFLRYWGGGI